MSKPNVIFDQVSIVLIGSFNPTIFHPSWLLHYGLIQERDKENAEVEVIHNDISIIRGQWFALEVTRSRFIAKSNDASHFEPLRDLVISIFKLLEHTPVNQMGLNRGLHFDVKIDQVWHKIGHVLAPKTIWRKYLKEPGLRALTIEGQRNDEFKGNINVTVRPVIGSSYAVAVAVNNHCELSDKQDLRISDLLADHWLNAIKKASDISANIILDARAVK